MLPIYSKAFSKAPSSLPTVSRPSTLGMTTRSATCRISTSPIDHLSLAISVFKCGNSACVANTSPWRGPHWEFSNALIAWDGIHAHQCKEDVTVRGTRRSIPSVYKFSRQGSAAAVTLISLAGLHASSATPLDMDQRDLRFFCNTCGPMRYGHKYGRRAYTWRSAVRIVPIICFCLNDYVFVDMPFHSRARSPRLGCPY